MNGEKAGSDGGLSAGKFEIRRLTVRSTAPTARRSVAYLYGTCRRAVKRWEFWMNIFNTDTGFYP